MNIASTSLRKCFRGVAGQTLTRTYYKLKIQMRDDMLSIYFTEYLHGAKCYLCLGFTMVVLANIIKWNFTRNSDWQRDRDKSSYSFVILLYGRHKNLKVITQIIFQILRCKEVDLYRFKTSQTFPKESNSAVNELFHTCTLSAWSVLSMVSLVRQHILSLSQV